VFYTYDPIMPLHQCQALVFLGRTPGGGRAGLQPPRRCRRVAFDDSDYCEVHEDQAELQDLYRRLLRAGWEHTVERWERDQERVESRGR
jgi:hypothetical protein